MKQFAATGPSYRKVTFRHVCVCWLVVGSLIASVLTLWVGHKGKVCEGDDILMEKADDASDTLVTYTKLHGVTKFNNLLLTAVVTLKSHVVFPSFPFPVNLTQSVCKQHGDNQTSTECYCRLRIVPDIQQNVSTGGQLVWQVWCALSVNTHRKVCQLCCVMCSRNTFCVSRRTVYVRRFSCSCFVLQAHLL
jgi:hypothetical protein